MDINEIREGGFMNYEQIQQHLAMALLSLAPEHGDEILKLNFAVVNTQDNYQNGYIEITSPDWSIAQITIEKYTPWVLKVFPDKEIGIASHHTKYADLAEALLDAIMIFGGE